MNCQADKILYFLAPILFDINLTILFFDNNSLINQYTFTNSTGINDSLTLFYHCNDYYILYSINDSSSLFNHFEYNDVVTFYKNQFCDECKKDTSKLVFNYIKNFVFCGECIRKLINYVMSRRISNFLDEQYFNLECKDSLKVRLL